jgi:hypothetical protein
MPQTDPHQLRQILFLQSLEETDAMGKVIPLDTRERATKDSSGSDSFLATRTHKLLTSATEPVQRLAAWMAHPTWRWFSWIKIGLPIGAFLIGWMTNELGSDRVVNIIAFPLLGLVIWNLLVCGYMFLAELRHRPAAPFRWPEHRMREQLEKHLANSVADPTEREILSRSTLSFLGTWREQTAPQLKASMKLILHLGALLLAGGIVASMYVQGLRKEYRAGWESTFLQSSSLHSLLRVALGPASLVTGIEIPAEPAIAAMRVHPHEAIPATPASAAPFIHLWAATAGIFIGLPRLLLIALALREGKKHQPNWDNALQAYEASCHSLAAGQVSLIDVLPVYFTPESASAEAIRHCILQMWGGKARVNFLPPIPLGDETEYLDAWTPASHGTVLAFSFASTPEQEVQGEVIQLVNAKAAKTLIVTDALSFESRHGALPEFTQRIAQREAGWHRIIGDKIPWLNLTSSVVKNPLAAIASLRRAG